ncbi:MAG: hypothetical protein WKF36_09930 [Candidatus Nitrosocosmicus sp.]
MFADRFFYAGNAIIISLITITIDLFAVLIIGVSALQAMAPLITSVVIGPINRNNDAPIKGFINSLLLALELESANAILKIGMFIINNTNVDSHVSQDINDFIFFVAVLSVRITITKPSEGLILVKMLCLIKK